MSSAQMPSALKSWPPLITDARVPRWIRIRDVILTLLAWGLLVLLFRDAILLAYDYFRHPVFELTAVQPPDLIEHWGRLRYFVLISAVLMAWLCIRAALDFRRLRAASHSPQPPELTIAEQAARAGISEESVKEARNFKMTNVRFNDDGTIARFEEVRPDKTASATVPDAPIRLK